MDAETKAIVANQLRLKTEIPKIDLELHKIKIGIR